MRPNRAAEETRHEVAATVEAVSSASTLMRVTGHLDLATARHFAAALAEVITTRRPNVVIDASGLGFCDSAGLAALEMAGALAETCGGTVTVTRPRPGVARLLRITGLDSRFLRAAPAA
ncbi:STAS domain-containing protein [Actinomadura rifamycini]|uniref:STAS domain-containing protein n=1 Tax=Actinomadura rifamycini TaxID=31962 RepID=UPI000A07469A|nr:STAS domain-containing protein [Actinomadura rifamycini]